MFVLYEMENNVRIDPIHLGQDRGEAIQDEINRKLSNRVKLNVGLCILLWDIKSIGSGVIHPSDGGVHSKVTYRYVVFRPFQDEIIIGKIKNCSTEGVHVTLGFFDDILIPPQGLQYPSKFDEREQNWYWEYVDENDEKHELFMEKGQKVRFRVTSEKFVDTTPIPTAQTVSSSSAQSNPQDIQTNKAPYSLLGSVNEPGLGLLQWWN